MFQLWIVGILMNLFLFYSIFEVYFKSPIVSVDKRYSLDSSSVEVPFKRAVVFVADGLRADTFFDNPGRRPYLSNVMASETSVWGISDTRVPTESRPGHVAIFAGFYEDPSAIFVGWKENTVEFDNIFNQSSSSIALGTADNVRMFAKGVAESKILHDSFPPEWQDFSGRSTSRLNSWVIDYLVELGNAGKLPKEKELVIFLSLLATDVIGHAMKPASEAYKESVTQVDDIIKRTEKLLYKYYGDNDTLYIMTSDHGMTDWGSHGDGSKAETETPYVIWGKGIQKPDLHKNPRLNQADFTALLAGALGVGYPSNSMGRFPDAIWKDQRFIYEALKANFYQFQDLMDTKMRLIKSTRSFPIVEFQGKQLIQKKIQSALWHVNNREYSNAILEMKEAINVTFGGMLYYERYDQQLLMVLTTCNTIGWILFLGCIIIDVDHQEIKIISLKKFLISTTISVLLIKFLIGWSLWRLPYGFFPIYVSLLLISLVRYKATQMDSIGVRQIRTLTLLLIFCFIGAEVLVNSFDNRGILSIALILNTLWCISAKKMKNLQRILFFTLVAILAVFPIMPVIGKERSPLLMTLGPLISTVAVCILLYIQRKKTSFTLLSGQTVLLVLVSVLCHFPDFFLTRAIAWFSFAQSYFLPVFASTDTVTCRLISMFLAVASPFSFIAYSYEALFFPCLFLVLIILLKIELSDESMGDSWKDFLNLTNVSIMDRQKEWKEVDLQHIVREAWLHLFFIMLAFFGTGNIASINSFDPSSTRCFVTVFSPWIMMMVLIEKILGPFLLVSCFFRKLVRSKIQMERSFLIVLLLCQCMALHTFFNVKNQGSWLDIGTSVSYHVIVNVTSLVLFVFHFIADFLVSFEPWPESIKTHLSIPIHLESRKKNIKTF